MGRFINADGYASTGQGLLGNNMFAYCNNNPVIYSDPTGEFLTVTAACAIIVGTCGIFGGLMGAVSALTTGGDVLECAIEGAATGVIGSTCGLFISNPVVAVGVAAIGGFAADVATQATKQYIQSGSVRFSEIDYKRSGRTAILTGCGTAVPQFSSGAQSLAGTVGTCTTWVEASTLLTCYDIINTNCPDLMGPKGISNYISKNQAKRKHNARYYGVPCMEGSLTF